MIKLSVSDKGFALIRDAVVISSEASTVKYDDKYLNFYDTLLKGLMKTKNLTKHRELLAIEVDKKKIYNSLMSTKSNPKYAKKLLEVYHAIDLLNCRYRYVYTTKSSVKKLALEKNVVQTSNFNME